MKNSYMQQLGFNRNHVAFLAVGVVAFTALMLPKTGLKVSAMFSRADQPAVKMLTYEQARGDIYAQMNIGEEEQYLQNLDTQFALLDRGAANGAVLGEITGLGEIPSADQLVFPELEKAYPIQTVPESELATMTYYATASELEAKHDTVSIMGQLNSADPAVLRQSVTNWNALLTDLGRLPVPTNLVDEHRAKLSYYYSIMKMGEIYAGDGDESQLAYYLKAMISFENKLNSNEANLE